jgi:hypothetical protein
MVMTGYGTDHVRPDKFVEGINKVFDEWIAVKGRDVFTYRSYGHASPVTGTVSPRPAENRDWLSNKWENGVQFYKDMHKQ